MGRPRVTNSAHKKKQRERAVKAMAEGRTVTDAAKAAGVCRKTIYDWLGNDPDFQRAFDDATEQGTDLLEAEAFRRGERGYDEPVIYQGQMTFVGMDKEGNLCNPLSPLAVKNVPLTVRKHSDILLMFTLKARRPQKFRDNATIEHTGPKGGPIAVDLTKLTTDELNVIRSAHNRLAAVNGN